MGGGGGAEAGFFPQDFLHRKTEIFSHSPRVKIFFSGQSKNFFFLNSLHARNVFFLIYTFVYFLNPIYMGILLICSCIYVSWIFGSKCI